MRKLIFILLCAAVFVNSCKTDLDLLAPYEDITVVYGLLDPRDSAQYIKINKGFSGELNAAEMANESDSLYYGENELNVWLEEYDEDGERTSRSDIELYRTDEIPKDDGFFANNVNYLYKTTEDIDQRMTYQLWIENNTSGKRIYGETEVVDTNLTLSKPAPGFLPPVSFVLNTGGEYDDEVDIEILTPVDAVRFEGYMTFSYEEYTCSDTNGVEKDITYFLGELRSSSDEGNEKLNFQFNGQRFFSRLGDELKTDEDIFREAGFVDFEFLMAGEELSIYLTVNEPATGIVQDKPDYTNLKIEDNENGEKGRVVGIFSSRTSVQYKGKELSSNTQKALVNDEDTAPLNFCVPYAGPTVPYRCDPERCD